jgi:hypothetical protein
MDTRATPDDPLLLALKALPAARPLPANLATALLRLSDQTFQQWEAQRQPAPISSMVDGQRRYLVRDLVAFIEQHADRCGRPAGAQHPTFDAFLTHGAAEDLWTFGFVCLDLVGMRRPLDVLACLHLDDDQVQDVVCRSMTLREYLSEMSAYLAGFHAQRNAEDTASARTARALAIHSQPPQLRLGGS